VPAVLVQTEGLAQAQPAAQFGIAQARVSDLLRGKWDKFSLDMRYNLFSHMKPRVFSDW